MRDPRRWPLLSPLLVLVALVSVLAGGTVSASAGHGPETRVRAFDTTTANAVGQQSSETAGSVGQLRPSQPGLASGSWEATDKGWSVGDDIYAQTAKGTEPKWSTVRSRFWKNEASSPSIENWSDSNLARMEQGLAPERFSPAKGGIEKMELSHEPIPFRDGGTDVVPRWPKDHAAVDPWRRPGY